MHYPSLSTGGADRFVTLTRTDPDFAAYLRGTFSSDHLALPAETFGANSARERVTFQILPRNSIHRPSWIKIIARAVRIDLIHFTLAPLLMVWLQNRAAIESSLVLLSAALSVVALQSAAFLFNDYGDHVQGIDRLRHRRGSRVIQRGWLRAVTVLKGAWLSLILSLILAIPALMELPLKGVFLGLIAAAAGFVFSGAGWGLKSKGFGDLLVFLCFGPLLTWGFGLLFSGSSFEHLILGIPLGLVTAMFLQSRQLESIMQERESRSGTLVGRLGFDRSKRLLQVELLTLATVSGLPFALIAWPAAFGVSAVVGAAVLPLATRLNKISSPLSSMLVGYSNSVRLLQIFICLVWAGVFFFLYQW